MKGKFEEINESNLISIDTRKNPLFVEEVIWDSDMKCVKLLGNDQGQYCLLFNEYQDTCQLFRKTQDGYASVSYVTNLEIETQDITKAGFYLQQRQSAS